MMHEKISDALNQLDDDIIEETEQLRRNTGKYVGGSKRASIIKWISLTAACFCLFILVKEWIGNIPQGQEEYSSLPLLTVSDFVEGDMGYEGYNAYDISEIIGFNPWTESGEIAALPVYKNGTYHTAGTPHGLSEEEVLTRLTDTARALDMEILDTEYERAGDTASDTGLPSETIISIQSTAPDATIRAEADGTITIIYTNAEPLPEQFQFTDQSTETEQAEAVLGYWADQYADLLSFREQQQVLAGGYDLNGKFHRQYYLYDAGGDSTSDILNYNFNFAEFVLDDNGNLKIIHLHDKLAVAEKIADYPIITPEEARTLLLNGQYYTNSPYNFPGEQYIAHVELVYQATRLNQLFIPYYRFYAELPDESRETDLTLYTTYYVLAIPQDFISNETR